jgi:hypothetical protein
MVTLTKQPTDVFIRPGDADVIRTEVVTLMDELVAGVDAAPLRPVATSASNVTVVAARHRQACSSRRGRARSTLLAAATAGNGFTIYVQANGGAVTIDPNGSEQINGGTDAGTGRWRGSHRDLHRNGLARDRGHQPRLARVGGKRGRRHGDRQTWCSS